jgi:hypothetical protein
MVKNSVSFSERKEVRCFDRAKPASVIGLDPTFEDTICRCKCMRFVCGKDHSENGFGKATDAVHWLFDPYGEERTFAAEVAIVVAISIAFAPLSDMGILSFAIFWIVWETFVLWQQIETARICPVHRTYRFFTLSRFAKRATIVGIAIFSRLFCKRYLCSRRDKRKV